MSRKIFYTLAFCVSASFITLAVAAYLRLPPWATTAGSMTPLLYYHLFYLRPRATNGLDQSTIDSVYYFGFLITVFALGISAITIAIEGAADSIQIIVYQFGTGLFATGYAVLARMHLTSMGGHGDATPDTEMDKCVRHSMEMLTNIEMASARLEEFWNAMANKTAKVNATALQTVEAAFLDLASTFREEMKTCLSSTLETIAQIRGLVADLSFTHEREALNRSVHSTIDACAQLNTAMAALTSKMENGGRSMQQEIASIDALNLVLDRFVERVESLGGANGALSQASTGMLAVSKSAAASNVAIRKSVDGLSEVANRVANAGNVIAQMQEISKTASMQLASLASASERIAGALAAIESSTVATDTLQSCIAKLSSAFQPLSVRADMLTGQLEKAGHVSERLENQFSGLPRYAALLKDTEQGMSQSLRQITHSLSTAATQAQQLSLNTENSAKALESANKLLSSAENLQEAVSALRQLFGDLTKSIAATQTLLSDSSRGFKEAISHSVLAIDSASKRISGAGNLTSARSASSDDVLPSAYGFGGRRRDENV